MYKIGEKEYQISGTPLRLFYGDNHICDVVGCFNEKELGKFVHKSLIEYCIEHKLTISTLEVKK